MALTKAEIADALSESLGLFRKDAKTMVEIIFEEIRCALESGEMVKIAGFGNFKLRDKEERPGRNPKTGQDVAISARRVVTFQPGPKLKGRIEEYEGPIEEA